MRSRFIDDNTILWQTQKTNTPDVTAEAYDLHEKEFFTPDNPIVKMDAKGGSIYTDGNFWALANVPSGDSDAEDTTYDLYVWHKSWKEVRKLASPLGPAYLSTDTDALADGRLAYNLPISGPVLIDLNTGIAQPVMHDQSTLTITADTAKVVWAQKTRESYNRFETLIPISELAQPGPCVGKLGS